MDTANFVSMKWSAKTCFTSGNLFAGDNIFIPQKTSDDRPVVCCISERFVHLEDALNFNVPNLFRLHFEVSNQEVYSRFPLDFKP